MGHDGAKRFANILISVCLCTALLAAGSAQEKKSESPEPDLPVLQEKVTVVGTLERAQVVQTVSVLSGQDLRLQSANTLQNILSEIPGVFSLSTSAFGQAGSTYIRGCKSGQILLQVDGVTLRDNSSISGLPFTAWAPSIVERMEVVSGPMATRYGSDAMGGVIALQTLPQAGERISISTGSHGSREGSAAWGTRLAEGLHLSLRAHHRHLSDGVDNDTFNNTGFAGKLSHDWEGGSGALLLMGDLGSGGIPFSGSTPTPERHFSTRTLMLASPWSWDLSPAWSLHLQASAQENRYRFDDPQDAWSGHQFSRARSLTLEGRIKGALTSTLSLTAGTEWQGERILSEGTSGIQIDDAGNHHAAGWVEGVWSLNGLTLHAGLRADAYKGVDPALTPQLGASWLLSPHWKIRASWAHSFKAPLLIYQINVWGLPNPDLKPERCRSWETGLEHFARWGHLSVTFFDHHYDRMIDWVTVDPVTYSGQYQNISQVDTRGLETALSLQPLARISLNLGHTYLYTRDQDTGKPLLRRPRHTFSAQLLYRHPWATLSVGTHVVGSRPDVVYQGWTAVNETNPAYQTIQARITVPVGPVWSLFLSAENLLNHHYEAVLGYPSPGRRVLMGLTYSHEQP